MAALTTRDRHLAEYAMTMQRIYPLRGDQDRPILCRRCGLGINPLDPLFHEDRYGHTPEWDEEVSL